MQPVYLSNFQSILPTYQLKQEDLQDWMCQVAQQGIFDNKARDPQKLIQRFACKADKIATRYSFSPDFAKKPCEETSQLITIGESGVLPDRMKHFSKVSEDIFEEFYSHRRQPSEIVHVSCTGYESPSGAQKLVSRKGWGNSTRVTHFYHMGCYAAMSAVRSLAPQVRQTQEVVDIAHTELCTLHINPFDFSPEQIVIKSLFADGAIQYQLSSDFDEPRGFEVLACAETLLPGTLDMMLWTLGSNHFDMTLARKVPRVIEANIAQFLEQTLETYQIRDQVDDKTIFAIHPGGPSIVETVERALGLESWQSAHSRDVLFRHGNMSSATLPHVWQNLLAEPELKPGQIIVSFAFGPGISVFTNILRLVEQ